MVRADAKRNREQLIRAAAAAFREIDVDVPMAEVARRAGLGVGTIYRQFPTRSELIVAVFRHEVEACATFADKAARENKPFAALLCWVRSFVDLIVTKRGLAEALHSDEPAYEGLAEYFEHTLIPPLEALLNAAKDEIAVEVAPGELLRAVGRICGPAPKGDLEQVYRMTSLIINGLRVRDAHQL